MTAYTVATITTETANASTVHHWAISSSGACHEVFLHAQATRFASMSGAAIAAIKAELEWVEILTVEDDIPTQQIGIKPKSAIA